MLEVRFLTATLKNLLEVLTQTVEHGEAVFSESGLDICILDPSNVMFTMVHMDVDFFKFYRCDEPTTLGLVFTSMLKISKSAKHKIASISYNPNDPDLITMLFDNGSEDAEEYSEYTIKLLDIDCTRYQIPDTKYAANVTLPFWKYADKIKEATCISGDKLDVKIGPNVFKITAEGEIGTANLYVNKDRNKKKLGQKRKDPDNNVGNKKITKKKKHSDDDDEKEKKIEDDDIVFAVTDTIVNTFSSKFLLKTLSAGVLSDRVTFSMTFETPGKIYFGFEMGSITYHLAPRVDP